MSPTQIPVWNTPEGHDRVRQILLQSNPPIEPHDYQTEGICLSLDGEDVLVTMGTGTGKTGFFSLTMKVMLEILENPNLALPGSQKFPSNPAMLLVLPTKALQEDMRKALAKLGLDVVVINADTCATARERKRNLWTECSKKHTIVLISPEEMLSPEFRRLLDDEDFVERVCRFGVDEVHLIYVWGQSFRQSFLQMGHMRARLPSRYQRHVPLIAASATIRNGAPKSTICAVLGLEEGQYSMIRRSNRRSNRRSDVQLLVRPMKSSTTSFSFSELDWVLNEPDTTVIFCKTIALGFRVTVHLWHLAISKGLIDVAKRIRMFNSLNSAAFNIDTLQFVDEPGSPSVVIATDVLSVGWDGQLTRNAVIFGEPDNIDDFVQKIGRVGRNRTLVTSPRGILYHSKQALSTAKSVMEQSSRGTKDTQVMDPSMARFLLAKCKRSNIDEQYNDPTGDKPCGCTSCLARRTPDDGMGTCNCSGCMPETTFQFVEETFNGPEAKQRARPGEGISKNMRTHGTGVLESLRYEIYWTSIHGSFDTPYIYLPSSLITKLIDSIYSIDSVSDVKNIVSGHQRLEGHHQRLYDACEDLRKDFAGIRALEKRERLAKKAAGTAEAVLGSNSAHNGGGIIVNSEEGNGEELTLNPVSQTGIK